MSEDDEALARKLQEELNAEFSTSNFDSLLEQQNQMEADLALAKKLLEEEEKALKSNGNKTSQNSTSIGEKGSYIETNDIAKKQQEELDMIIAMKLQEEVYQESEFKNKPPPSPTFYYPSNSAPQHKNFVKQKSDHSVPPTSECVKRITSDMKEVMTSKNRYIHISPDENDITHIQALIVGPPDTPYAYGFFHFDMIFPHDYPWNPPKVQIITTDSGNVRFNPNLYANGKVCLSILGTWSGPGWTQVQTMLSTLLSIQSLMNSKPYQNEPGFEYERKSGDIKKYNDCILHETLRVAVCGMMENPTCGNLFEDVMEEWFLEKFNEYEQTCLNLKDAFDGKIMEDPFGERRGNFRYGEILTRLRAIKKRLDEKRKMEEDTEEQEKNEDQNLVPTEKTVEMDQQNPSTEVKAPEENVSSPQPSTTKPSSETPPTSITPEIFAQQIQLTLSSLSSAPSSTIDLSSLDLDSTLSSLLQQQSSKPVQSGSDLVYQIPLNFSPSSKTVKPPSLQELKKQEVSPPEKEESDIICLICHNSPREYVVLPSCQQPHIYCMTCANKMVKNQSVNNPISYRFPNRNASNKRTTSGQSIQCVLCNSSSSLDPIGGLSSLRRRKRRKMEEKKPICPIHNEEFMLFCLDDMESICYVCAGSTHSKHNFEALDVAYKKLDSQLNTQLKIMEQKRSKLESFINSVTLQQSQLETSSKSVRKEAKEKFAALRKLLDEKEQEVDETILRTFQTKSKNIDSELKKAKERIQQIDSNFSTVADMRSYGSSNPLIYLQKMEDVEEHLRHACSASDPEIKSKWFQMMPLGTSYLEQSLQALRYKNKKPIGIYGLPEEDEISYEESEEEYY